MADSRTGKTSPKSYQWTVLQEGTLPLRPNGKVNQGVEHRCTSVLIWPDGEQPSATNTVLADPCFTVRGFAQAAKRLNELGLYPADLMEFFVTHPHLDHTPQFPRTAGALNLLPFFPGENEALSGLSVAPCPGHDADLFALIFHSPEGESVWIVGDAIIDVEWLAAWKYYWPNAYTPADIAQTWRSVASILSQADVVVPGHGLPFPVTSKLVKKLLKGFSSAPHADLCPEVEQTLRKRLERLS